ncbi:MAG TPA: ABC transporter substrate-binding protein [Burkholderiales bacterium]|nr:ABC transporter substrate-binding protein [Burkholderiales bacterium]
MTRYWAAVLCGLLLAAAASAADTTPDALVKTTVADVLQVIKQNRDRRTLVDVAEKKVLPHFDFESMTRLAVGKAWREATPEQRKALQDNFRALLVNTYTTALSQQETADPTFEVKPVQVAAGQKDVTVHSVVSQAGRQPVAVDYRMERKDDGWKVYDVIVENLSLVTNYRSTFASEIAKGGIDGLIKSLQTKNKQIGTG